MGEFNMRGPICASCGFFYKDHVDLKTCPTGVRQPPAFRVEKTESCGAMWIGDRPADVTWKPPPVYTVNGVPIIQPEMQGMVLSSDEKGLGKTAKPTRHNPRGIPWDFLQGEKDGTADGTAGVAPTCQGIMEWYSNAYRRGYRQGYDTAVAVRLEEAERRNRGQ